MKFWAKINTTKNLVALVAVVVVIGAGVFLISKGTQGAESAQASLDSSQNMDSAVPVETPDNDWGCLIPKTEYIILYTEEKTMEGFYITNNGINDDYIDENAIWFISNEHKKKDWDGKYATSVTPITTSDLVDLTDADKRIIVGNTLRYIKSTYDGFNAYYEKCYTAEDKEFITARIDELADQYNAYIASDGKICKDIIPQEIPEELAYVK